MSIIPERLPKKPHEYVAGLLILINMLIFGLGVYVITVKYKQTQHAHHKPEINSQGLF